MTIPGHLLPRQVEWVRAGVRTDRYGNTLPDWDHPTTTTIAAWVEQPAPGLPFAAEIYEGQDRLISKLMLLVTNTQGLKATDRVVVDEVTYELTNEPAVLHSPRGADHVEATMQKLEG